MLEVVGDLRLLLRANLGAIITIVSANRTSVMRLRCSLIYI
jgi:hypothetical protein